MPEDQHLEQGRWKVRKRSSDAVGQTMRKPLHFLTRIDMFQVRYLPSVTPRFLNTGLASVVSRRNRTHADLSRDNSDES